MNMQITPKDLGAAFIAGKTSKDQDPSAVGGPKGTEGSDQASEAKTDPSSAGTGSGQFPGVDISVRQAAQDNMTGDKTLANA